MVILERSRLLAPEYRAFTVGGVALVALSAFESVAVSTAMPTVAKALGGIGSYPLAFGIPVAAGIVGMVAAGVVSDRRGPARVLATGWLLFVLGLLLAGVSVTMPMLIGGRAIQGLGSGVMTVALYVVVARVIPEDLRPRLFSAFSAAWVVPALVGPLISGLLVVHLGWRSVFLSVPVLALAAAAASWRQVRAGGLEARPVSLPAQPSRTGLVQVGAALAAGGAACLLSMAGLLPAGTAVVAVAVSLVLMVVAVPRLLPRGTYRAARGLPAVILLRGLTAAAFFEAEIFLPLLLSRERGLSPAQAGAALTVGALGWAAGSAWQGRYSNGSRRPGIARWGLVGVAAGVATAATVVSPGVWLPMVFVGWAVAGVGIGAVYPTLSVLTLELSAPGESGQNSAALQVNEALLVSVALAVSGAIFAALVDRSHSAPYLAGFAIAASAAVVGALLASRLRAGDSRSQNR